MYSDFHYDKWTPAQWERAMRAAYTEAKAKGVPAPHITYREAYAYHLRMTGQPVH